jgi:DNA-binding CsgD family transcriptional regulator
MAQPGAANRYTAREETRIVELLRQGKTPYSIALELGRNPKGVRRAIERLKTRGIIK